MASEVVRAIRLPTKSSDWLVNLFNLARLAGSDWVRRLRLRRFAPSGMYSVKRSLHPFQARDQQAVAHEERISVAEPVDSHNFVDRGVELYGNIVKRIPRLYDINWQGCILG